jgi:ABC-type sugar transport system ATPase subunit
VADLHLKAVSNPFIHNIDMHASDGEMLAVVGPSGAGKTSLLRVIAGLADHDGLVLIDQKNVSRTPPDRRSVGYVSQDLHLFPHLTLEGNLFLAMERLKWTKSRKRSRAADLIDLLRIGHLSGRKPATFSGGEKQRAALARVLASNPKILLLDEPFSKLDFRTARYLRSEFRDLQKKLTLTTILVTHNLEEAREMAGRIAVMQSGVLDVFSSKRSVSEDLQNNFLDTPNVLACRFLNTLEHGLVEVEWAGVPLVVPDEGRKFSHIIINRRNIELGATPPNGPPINRFTGIIRNAEPADDAVLITLDVNKQTLHVEISNEKWLKLSLEPGRRVHGFIRLKDIEVSWSGNVSGKASQMDIYQRLQKGFQDIIQKNNLGDVTIKVEAKALTPEQAIGNPEDDDYPIIKGRERIMEAEFRGDRGHAFTDLYGNHTDTLQRIAEMDLTNNFRRAVFLSSLNAVTRHLGIADKTVHCKDDAPPQCAKELAGHIVENYGNPKIAIVGFQPRMIQELTARFPCRVTDLDEDNIGTEKFGVMVQGPDMTKENLEWCDLALVTGSTLANASIMELLSEKPTIFFGVTVAAAAAMLDLNRFCPLGT